MVDWTRTWEELSTADRAGSLDAAGLERLAMAAYLTGRDGESVDVLTRAHNAFLESGDPSRAARAAFWIGFILINSGERARAGGWLARGRRLLDDGHRDCVECGYMLLPVALQHVGEGHIETAEATFAEAAAIGKRFGDPDLVNLALQGRGRALIALGRVAEGVAMLDEVMVAVTSGEVSPIITGTVYCSVISACFELFDMRRAQEWTGALAGWCASQPGLVPYRGECLVHRAEIMQLHGGWSDALDEARRACDSLSHASRNAAAGAAFYQVGELHRVRGEFAEAEDAYQRAHQLGRMPQPGMALLRLAQGRRDTAKAAITRVLDEARDVRVRSRVLPAAVDIMLCPRIASGAAGPADRDEVAAARVAAEELASIAASLQTPFVRARSAHASGAVALAAGNARDALAMLREAAAIWRELDFPYEAARTTVLVARACQALGDADSAEMEMRAAARAFGQLGASTDLARIGVDQPVAPPGGQLTARELDVLKLVAGGKSNRVIAEELGISEKTVARHISNMFTKLDLPSRAAATAYAFKNKLV